ncbi:hypothetical protein [Persephonella sp.]|uniref:hypothetical protein n=1 Tax=Persephonella sp. TaxID=2060922 RepID=UPI0025D669BF|nr:hypothetical protein [Persephonella sp.]
MSKTIELSEYLGFLEEINNLPEIEKAQIIEVPEEDAEFDISLKIKTKAGIDKWKLQRKIQDLRWKYSKEYDPLTLYLEIE